MLLSTALKVGHVPRAQNTEVKLVPLDYMGGIVMLVDNDAAVAWMKGISCG